jgi:predicted DNA-binding transcriptional regulator AlpA
MRNRRWLNGPEVAAFLGISRDAVRSLLKRDPSFPRAERINWKVVLWDEDEVQRWRAEQAVQQNEQCTAGRVRGAAEELPLWSCDHWPADLVTCKEAARRAGVGEEQVLGWADYMALERWPGTRETGPRFSLAAVLALAEGVRVARQRRARHGVWLGVRLPPAPAESEASC